MRKVGSNTRTKLFSALAAVVVSASMAVGCSGGDPVADYYDAKAVYNAEYDSLEATRDLVASNISAAKDHIELVQRSLTTDYSPESDPLIQDALRLHQQWGAFGSQLPVRLESSIEPAISSGTATEDGIIAAAAQYDQATAALKAQESSWTEAVDGTAAYAQAAALARPIAQEALNKQASKDEKDADDLRLEKDKKEKEQLQSDYAALTTQFDQAWEQWEQTQAIIDNWLPVICNYGEDFDTGCVGNDVILDEGFNWIISTQYDGDEGSGYHSDVNPLITYGHDSELTSKLHDQFNIVSREIPSSETYQTIKSLYGDFATLAVPYNQMAQIQIIEGQVAFCEDYRGWPSECTSEDVRGFYAILPH